METESENKNDNPEEEVNSEPKIAEEEAHDVKSEKQDLDSEATPENLSKKYRKPMLRTKIGRISILGFLLIWKILNGDKLKRGKMLFSEQDLRFLATFYLLGRISNGHA